MGTASATRVPAGATTALTTEVCRDADAFGALGDQWQALFRRCPPATPFQTHAWLHSWWLSYGSAGRLRVVLVRRGGELVAAAPLMLVRRPLPVLVPLGGAVTDFHDVLLDHGAGMDEAARALREALAALARRAVVDLRDVRPGAAVEQIVAGWRGPVRTLSDSVCLELPGAPVEVLAARLATARCQRVRAKLRKADALGVETRQVPPERVPSAVVRLVELHRAQWQGRGGNPEHLTPRFTAHLIRAVTAMAASGEAVLTEFVLEGRQVMSDLTLRSPRLCGGYLYGADPVLRARKVDVSVLLLRNSAAHFADAPAGGTLSMLRGTEPYKQHWRPDPVVNRRLLLAPPDSPGPSLVLRAMAARHEARGRAAVLVRRRRAGSRRSGGQGGG